MSRATEPSRRRTDRLLALLAEAEGVLERTEPPTLRIVAAAGLRRLRVDPAELDALVAADLLTEIADPADPGPRRFATTSAGRARVARATPDGDDFRRQHGGLARRALDEGGAPVLVDDAESPLAWLARRRGKDGRAFLTPARVAAGERLRADFTLAQMMPTVTSNWSSGRVAAGKGGLADLTDRAVAARSRVRAAVDAVGTELADVLIDVCCFLKGLETVESDRRWPVRSAKVVLDIALGRLAAHYGLAEEARGPERGRGLRAWGSDDHRPTIGRPVER